jgi:hypothetical protein
MKLVIATISIGLGALSLAFACSGPSFTPDDEAALVHAREAKSSANAFKAAYAVLISPRCLNCHPEGDRPLQNDEGWRHAMNVQRGPDGKGHYAEKCASCHQETNLPGAHMPPGAPNWHLPSKDTPLVFEHKLPGELCRQLKDPKRNGGKTIAQLLEHVTSDPLVMWGWAPGEGRTLPPMTHAEFVRTMREWADKGCSCPD